MLHTILRAPFVFAKEVALHTARVATPVAAGSGADSAVLPAPRPTRLLDRLREQVRALHYSYRTEKAYVYWGSVEFRVGYRA